MKKGDRVATPGGWIAAVQSGKTSGGTIAIVWLTGPLVGRDARILHKGCRVLPEPVAPPQRSKQRRGRIISRGGKIIG